MAERLEIIVETLRGRILRGVQAGTLRAGDRLPSARELALEFDVDYRVILSAYRTLTEEQLVELRPRGGVYVAARDAGSGGVPPLPEAWFADLLAEGVVREIPAPELHEWLRRVTETLHMRAVVVSTTVDQVFGLSRELRDDFGFDSEGLVEAEVRGVTPPPITVRRADLLLCTSAHESWMRAVAESTRKPLIVVDVRPDLLGGEWALLLRRPVYAVVATPEFGDMMRTFFAEVPGIENLRILVFGRDDLGEIPADAPTYVTQRVRAQIGSVEMRGRILPAARTIASESAREIFRFIVRSNVEALRGRG